MRFLSLIGILGTIAGIYLMLFEGDWVTGFFGAISSAGLIYLSFTNHNLAQESEEQTDK